MHCWCVVWVCCQRRLLRGHFIQGWLVSLVLTCFCLFVKEPSWMAMHFNLFDKCNCNACSWFKSNSEVFSDLYSLTLTVCSFLVRDQDPDVAWSPFQVLGKGQEVGGGNEIYVDVFLYTVVSITYVLNLPFPVTIFGNIYLEIQDTALWSWTCCF